MVKTEPTISATLMRTNLTGLAEIFGDSVYEYVEEKYGFTLKQLQDDDLRAPIRIMVDLVNRAADQVNDPVLGLKSVPALVAKGLSHTSKIVYSAINNRCMLEMLTRYMHLMTEMGDFKLTSENDIGRVEFIPVVDPEISYHQIDAMLAFIVAMFAEVKQDDFSCVRLKHDLPAGCKDKYLRTFNTKVLFDQPINSIEFSMEWLKKTIPEGSLCLTTLVDLEKMSEKVDENKTFVEQISGVLSSSLVLGEPRREEVASAWGLSVSTLQRKLRNLGTSFQEILESVRFEKAKQYLADPIYTCEEIAFLVGYSEVRPFYIAFNRWTGVAPGQYRKSSIKYKRDMK